MKVLSLFDGISCGMVALERAGIPVEKYYSSEIDDSAIKISNKNYPNIIRLGDVTQWRKWDIAWSEIDLLIGGSPCQGFSFAGKQLNFDDPRSKLFFEFVDILKHIKKRNPNVKFMLENVKMRKEYQDIISEHLGVEPIEICSSVIAVACRKRLYWANFEIKPIQQTESYFSDIIDKNDDNKKWLTDDEVEKLITWKGYEKKKEKAIRDYKTKIPCLLARGYQSKHKMMFLVYENNKYRYITHNEAELAMTLPLDYTNADIPPSKREQAIGNGWTVDIIAAIFKNLSNESSRINCQTVKPKQQGLKSLLKSVFNRKRQAKIQGV